MKDRKWKITRRGTPQILSQIVPNSEQEHALVKMYEEHKPKETRIPPNEFVSHLIAHAAQAQPESAMQPEGEEGEQNKPNQTTANQTTPNQPKKRKRSKNKRKKEKVQCECGALIYPRQMASHIGGQAHVARMKLR